MSGTVVETPIARLLRSRPYSDAKVARECGITVSKLNRLKHGGSAVLRAEEAVKLAKLFGVAVEELLPQEVA